MAYLGHIACKAAHVGATYQLRKETYHICDGSAISRATYAGLSALWPTGAYGSTVSDIHLPDFREGVYFRGADLGRDVDEDYASRTVLSGGTTSPITSGVGSYQTANMVQHTHPYGTQPGFSRSNGGGDGNCCYPVSQGSFASPGPISITSPWPTASGDASNSAFDVNHMRVYAYICILVEY